MGDKYKIFFAMLIYVVKTKNVNILFWYTIKSKQKRQGIIWIQKRMLDTNLILIYVIWFGMYMHSLDGQIYVVLLIVTFLLDYRLCTFLKDINILP